MASIHAATDAATASYIEYMLSELRGMSKKMDAQFLTYLMEMAMVEAADIAKHGRPMVIEDRNEIAVIQTQKLYMNDELD